MRSLLSWRRFSAAACALLAVTCLGWGVFALFQTLRPPHWSQVRLGVGSVAQRRFQIAEAFSRGARQHDLAIEIIATDGLEPTIRQVAQHQLDMAGVPSGLIIPECKDVRLLASLDVAPLHILVRRDLATKCDALIELIRGHRVNVGPPGTNDYLLANDLLSFLRLRPSVAEQTGDFTPTFLTKDELSARALDIQGLDGPQRQQRLAELPDVIFALLALPSPLAQSLLDTGLYTLVPFPYTEPFLMSNFSSDPAAEQTVDRVLVERATIRAGMYVAESPIPHADCSTIGLRTLLVARADMPAETVHRVLRTIFETDLARRVKPHAPHEFASNYQVHPAAQAYFDRDKPLLTSSFMADLSEFFSIFGAFIAGALSLYGFLRRRRIRRPGDYLTEIQQIDALLNQREAGAESSTLPAELVQQLDTRLTQLKEQLIADYCSNRVQGEMVLLSILSSLADSRSQLRLSSERRGEPAPIAAARSPAVVFQPNAFAMPEHARNRAA